MQSPPYQVLETEGTFSGLLALVRGWGYSVTFRDKGVGKPAPPPKAAAQGDRAEAAERARARPKRPLDPDQLSLEVTWLLIK